MERIEACSFNPWELLPYIVYTFWSPCTKHTQKVLARAWLNIYAMSLWGICPNVNKRDGWQWLQPWARERRIDHRICIQLLTTYSPMRLCSELYSKALRGRFEVAQMLSENADSWVCLKPQMRLRDGVDSAVRQCLLDMLWNPTATSQATNETELNESAITEDMKQATDYAKVRVSCSKCDTTCMHGWCWSI